MLLLEQANRLRPADAEARRRLAAFYERAGQFEAVRLWREAVDLEPGHVGARLGLARAALRFGQPELARTELATVAAGNAPSAEYYRLRAALAVVDRDAVARERALTRVLELEPDDDRVRVSLAAVQLADPAGPAAPAARAALVELARRDRVRLRAVVELLSDIARRWPAPSPAREAELRRLAGELAPAYGPRLATPGQVDHLGRLVVFAMSQPAPEAEDVVGLAHWLALNAQVDAAAHWFEALPPRLREHPLVKRVEADLAIRQRDWARLRRLLLNGAWGAVPAGAVDQAFRAHTREESRPAAWSAAIQSARGSGPGARALLRLAELWEWPAERRQVLLAIARDAPRESWAWRELLSDALGQTDSSRLWQTYQEWRLLQPGDPVVQVETAIVGFLLGRKPVPGPAETAHFVTRAPDSAGAAVAHALALWQAGRAAEGAALLDAQPRSVFADARYGLARAVVLTAAGRPEESEQLLAQLPGDAFLPEERQLLAATRERNRR